MVDGWRTGLNVLIFVFASGCPGAAFAHEATLAICKDALAVHRPVTLNLVRALAIEQNQQARRHTPAVDFFDLAGQARVEHVADSRTPGAVAQFTTRDVGAVALPTPTSPDEVSIGLIEERHSFVVHVKTEWAGHVRTTAAYVTLPGAKIRSAGDYLIGPEIKGVVPFLHGGGTPTATGKNGVSIGERLAPRGFATIAIDQPGHGIATKNLHGFETTEQQMNFILKVLNQLIHPSVPRVGVGHSWGAQLYAYAHRHSADPKYASFKHFVILSPPVDPSHCGDLRAKADFEADWVRRRPEFKDRIAATDNDFLDNLLKNGKDSEIGRIFCSATDRDYATPPLSLDEQSRLVPATVIIGLNDYLFVGREEAYRKAWGGLQAPSRYIELGRGQTFDGARDTGHNVFDLRDETGRELVYGLIGDVLRDVTGHEPTDTSKMADLIKLVHTNFPNLLDERESALAPVGVHRRLDVLRAYVRDFDQIPNLAKDEKKTYEARVLQAYSELMALENVARAYWNYVGFRALLKDEVQNVETNSVDTPRLAARKLAIDRYERDMNTAREDNLKEHKAALRIAIEAVAVRHGLPASFDLKRANEELGYAALTDERRAAITSLIDENERFTALHGRDSDAEYDRDLEHLSAQYATTLAAVGVPVERYAEARARYTGNGKGMSREQNVIRMDLSNLHREYLAAVKARDARSTARRAEHLKPYAEAVGISDPRLARRELDADRSPARRATLNSFIAEAERAAAEVDAAAGTRLAQALADVQRPADLASDVELAELKRDHDKVMKLAYAPRGLGLDELVEQMNLTRDARDEAQKGRADQPHIDKLSQQTEELRQERVQAIAEWNLLWERDSFGSTRTDADQARLNLLEANYRRSYDVWVDLATARDLELQLADQWTAETVSDLPPELREKFDDYVLAKQEYLAEKGTLDQTRVNEALAGNLQPRAYLEGEAAHAATRAVLKAVAQAKRIWSPHHLHAPAEHDESLTARLLHLEQTLEERRQRLTALNKQFADLRLRYVTRMRELGQPLPTDILRVRLTDLFNRHLTLDGVLERMDQDPRLYVAIEQTLQQWEGLMKQLRSLHNRGKDSGGY